MVRDDKTTTKVRIVFDASAKNRGPSLNDCLLKGPSLTAPLFGVLLHFRAYNVAVLGDLEKVFHQISVNPEDRDFLRFIWFNDVSNLDYENFENNETIEYRLARVLFGATCSSFLLTATLITYINKFVEVDPEFVEKLLDSLHVDDLITGCDNDSEAYMFFKKCINRLREGGFNLRKFNSNSLTLEKMINSVESSEFHYDSNIKVLGINWNKVNDVFLFGFNEILNETKSPVTKRNIMHTIASIFDPLGLINPIEENFIPRFMCV